MKRKELEAEFHRRIKAHLTKSQQRLVMGELRAVLDEQQRIGDVNAASIEAYLADARERIYGLRDGE